MKPHIDIFEAQDIFVSRNIFLYLEIFKTGRDIFVEGAGKLFVNRTQYCS